MPAMDIMSTRKHHKTHPAPLRSKVKELYSLEKEQLQKNAEDAAKWLGEMRRPGDGRLAVQSANVVGMSRAVAVSSQPGAITYKVTAPDLGEADAYRKYIADLVKSSQQKDQLRAQISTTETQEKIQEVRDARAVCQRYKGENPWRDPTFAAGSLLEKWLDEYGRPKRDPGKEELYLTYNRGPISIVKSCSSKTTKSAAEQTNNSLSLLGQATLGQTLAPAQTRSLRRSEPLIKFETQRSMSNSYRRGRLCN